MKLARILNEIYCRPWLIRPEMHKQISKIVDAHCDGSAHAENGIAEMFEAQQEDIMREYKGCAVIDVNGVIGRKVSGIEKSSGVTDVNDIADAMAYCAEDDSVEGIVLSIDSPGGTVSGVPELAMLIQELGRDKAIVSYVDGMAASAAYWIASQTHGIVAGQSAVTGSIGVYMAMLDVSRAYEMQGAKMEVIKAGKYKGIGIEGTSLTDEQRSMLQAEVDAIHGMFKGSVRIGRGNIDDSVMQGQDFMGQAGVDAGLVDQIGNLDDAIELIRILNKGE